MDINRFTQKINNMVRFTQKGNASDDFYIHNLYFKKAILDKDEAYLEKNYLAETLRRLVIAKNAEGSFNPLFEISCHEASFLLGIPKDTALKLMVLGHYYKWWEVDFTLGISKDNCSLKTLAKVAENDGLHLFPLPSFEGVMLKVNLNPLDKLLKKTTTFATSNKLSNQFHIVDMTAYKVAINKTKADELQEDAFNILINSILVLTEANGIDFIRGWGVRHTSFEYILQSYPKALQLIALGEYYNWWKLHVHPHTSKTKNSPKAAEELIRLEPIRVFSKLKIQEIILNLRAA